MVTMVVVVIISNVVATVRCLSSLLPLFLLLFLSHMDSIWLEDKTFLDWGN